MNSLSLLLCRSISKFHIGGFTLGVSGLLPQKISVVRRGERRGTPLLIFPQVHACVRGRRRSYRFPLLLHFSVQLHLPLPSSLSVQHRRKVLHLLSIRKVPLGRRSLSPLDSAAPPLPLAAGRFPLAAAPSRRRSPPLTLSYCRVQKNIQGIGSNLL